MTISSKRILFLARFLFSCITCYYILLFFNGGVFVCFQEQVTKPMMLAVKDEGKYNFGKGMPKADCDKMQIITVEDLLEHKGIDMPTSSETTFKSAPKETLDTSTQTKLDI